MQIAGNLIECRQVDRLKNLKLVLLNQENDSTASSSRQANTIKTRPKIQSEYVRGTIDEVR